MCNEACIGFGQRMLTPEIVNNKRVIELGSYNVNGSLRDHVLSLNPLYYVGVDMVAGPCVDVVIVQKRIPKIVNIIILGW